MTIIDEYLSLTKKYKEEYSDKTLVLLQVGSFFECYAIIQSDGTYYGSNIQDFADINDFVISKKNTTHNGKPVAMAGFGITQLEKYVKRLQEADYTIVVYTQDSNTKNTTRSLSCIYSPGTYFSSDTSLLNNVISCIWVEYYSSNQLFNEKISVGMSSIDIFTGYSNTNYYTLDFVKGPSVFDELENYLNVNKPSECIFITNISSNNKNHIIIDYVIDLLSCKYHFITTNEKDDKYNPTFSAAIKNICKQKYQFEILSNFFADNNNIFSEYDLSTQSFCYLIQFIYKHNPNLTKKISVPNNFNKSTNLVLANHSLKQLNIISDCRYSGKYSSILNLLNNCITNIGKRSFNNQLLNPTTNVDFLKKVYDVTEHSISTCSYEKIRIILGNVKDLSKIYRKIVIGKLSPKDIYNFNKSIYYVNELYQLIMSDLTISNFIGNENIIYSISGIEAFFAEYINMESCINFEDINYEKYSINNISELKIFNENKFEKIDSLFNSFSELKNKFDYIRHFLDSSIKDYEQKMGINTAKKKVVGSSKRIVKEKSNNEIEITEVQNTVTEINNTITFRDQENNNFDYIKVHECPKSEPVLVGTTKRVSVLKKIIESLSSEHFNINNLEIKSHNGSNSMVTSKEIEELSKKIFKLKEDYFNELNKEFSNFCKMFVDRFQKQILNIIDYISECDLLQNRCYVAVKNKYCKPIISKSQSNSFVEFTELRHPLIEKINTNELYVTNDLSLGEKSYLLYGTNAVGKTSFIKSIGISIIMAQAGLFVPAETFNYYPYKSIFTRILGNDNLFKGLSTFAVEMSELRTILKYSDNNSLILGDELCSGTESTSALSIFTAGINYLSEKKSSFIFATHFHEILKYDEIKNLLYKNLKCIHLTVQYDKISGDLIYDRKIKDGSGDNMYGLEVCKSLNLSDDFLEFANNIRIRYNKPDKLIIENLTTRYNADKIRGLCEVCGEHQGTEIHHLIQQKDADLSNYNKKNINHNGNLINICEACHNYIHTNNIKYKKIKVGKSYKLIKV